MKVLARKLRRDFVAARGMLAAVVAILAFGIASLVGFQSTTNNLGAARDGYYAQCRMADFWIDVKKVPLAALPAVERIPGLAALRSRITAEVIVDLPGVIEPIAGRLISMPGARAGGVTGASTGVINDLLLTSGQWFSAPDAAETIVSREFAAQRGLAPGDAVHLIIDGQRKALRVVGIGISAEFVYLIPPGGILPEPANFGVFYVPRRFAENSLDMAGAANSLVGELIQTGDPAAAANPEPVLRQINQLLAPFGVFALTPRAQQGSNLNLTAELGGLATMAAIIPLIFLSVAALVLNVLMTRLAAQQRVIVGTLKALGYHNRAIFGHFIQVGVIVGLIGGVLGILLGLGLAAALTDFYRQFFTFPSLTARLYPGLMLLSLAVAIGFAVLGSWRGVRHVARLEPAEAMRPPPPPVGGAILLERWPALWRRFGFFWQMALRSLFRNRMRSVVSILAAALGTSLLVSTYGSLDSLKFMVLFQFDKVMLADYSISFRADLDAGALIEAARLPGVIHAEPQFVLAVDFVNANHHHKGAILGVTPDAILTVPRDTDGHAVPIPASGLLMAKRLAENLGVEPGNAVWILPSKGTQTPRRVPVARLVDSLFGLGVYADYHWLNALVTESGAVSSVRLKVAQDAATRDAFYRELKRLPTLLSVQDMAAVRANMWQTFVVKMGSMLNVMILFAAVIFFGAILNGALISLIERQRELATYRVLGYRPGEVGAMYLRESLVLNGLGILLGLPLGYWMTLGMNSQYQNDLYSMPTVITASGWFWSIAMAVIFVLLCQWIVQHRIDRMPWNQALAMKE
ncbi:macrolide transporter ATP-binding /permease protein [Thiorhodovibrio winogradskyi]|uniref:Macrolide transporter ATP-binding /permease protein n=1 Tax=Thiorhodovibrio winogradskyi TaxID=77007 RepID=A0ABZ0SAH0_9GAMM|nr:FtsX-like permease family protein [Thiorhodovibrio winogradskyi]